MLFVISQFPSTKVHYMAASHLFASITFSKEGAPHQNPVSDIRTFNAFGRWAPEAPIDQTLRFVVYLGTRRNEAFGRWAPQAPIDQTH